ncbi:MAG: hypothetical protein O2923_02020 [Verrucomicrobia bacterium]|nr:hypothetical protein [Verrucomicrobiota bacterium]MDA1086840.1 hypothetical protein [Verrucomicrobiota bacterium]
MLSTICPKRRPAALVETALLLICSARHSNAQTEPMQLLRLKNGDEVRGTLQALHAHALDPVGRMVDLPKRASADLFEHGRRAP